MKKICFSFNHLQYSDGIARSAIGISNYLSSHYDVEITLRPIYKFERETREIIDECVSIRPVFGFFFHGMSKIVNKIPHRLLHCLIYGNNKYDIEVGFQHGTSTIAVTSGKTNDTTKHFVWMHGYDVGLTMLPYYRKADKVICVSRYNAHRVFRETNGEINADFSYNLIDEKKVCEEGKQTIDLVHGKGPVFVSVGRQSEEKGYKRLINCVSKLKKEGYNFSLWLIGDGPEHQDLMASAKKNDVDDRIVFTGAQSNPHKYTSKADLFICSSFSEGYCTACIEAIMLGVPILTTEVSGANEIIELAEAGMIVENSEEGLEKGLRKVLDNPDMMNNWKTVLNHTKSRFSIDSRAQKLIDIFSLQ